MKTAGETIDGVIVKLQRRYSKLPHTFLEAWQLQIEADSSKGRADAIRMAFLINGGALIAIMTLIGALPERDPPTMEAAANATAFFSAGLVLTLLAALVEAWHRDVVTSLFSKLWTREDDLGRDDVVSVALSRMLVWLFLGLGLLSSVAGFWVATIDLAVSLQFLEPSDIAPAAANATDKATAVSKAAS